MGKMGMNLQDSFLNQVRKDNTEIQLVLLDGTRLTGVVRGFDNFTVIMNSRGQQHLIYKHAIAQIISRRPTHFEPMREGEENGAHEIVAEEGAAETFEAPESQQGPESHHASQAPAPNAERRSEPRHDRDRGNRRRDDRRGQGRRGNRRRDDRRDQGRRDDRRERGPRRDEGRRGEGHPDESHREKFNAIDFSQLNKVKTEPPAEQPVEQPAEE